jgi:hypothetical protein
MPFVPKDQSQQAAQSTKGLTEESQEVNNQNIEEMINEFQQLYCDLKEYLQDQNSFMNVVQEEVPLDYNNIQVQEESNPYTGAF